MQLFVFALVMLVAATMMARPTPVRTVPPPPRARRWIILDGLAVGMLTGLVGIGGGFLILPALVLLGGLAMHRAIGTSLAIIALNAFSGFVQHASLLAAAGMALDWRLIGLFTAIGAGGSLIGGQLAERLPQHRLKRIFAFFLVLMGLFILVRTAPQLWLHRGSP